jgi:hypothetical protein
VWARRYASSPNGEWHVEAGPLRTKLFCARDGRESSCQTMRLHGDTLLLDSGSPQGPTLFQRVRRPP